MGIMEQLELLRKLGQRLNPRGIIAIGDVATQTRAEMDAACVKDLDDWDDDEFYIVVDELEALLEGVQIHFYKKSYCSGVCVIAADT